MIHVIVNGNPDQLDDGATVAALVAKYNLTPLRVAVELNRELVPRRDYAATVLKDGDRVEIVTFVGGG